MLVIFLPLLGQILTISVCRHIKGVLTIVDDVGGHFGFQVTLTLDSQNNIFIQSDSLDLVGIDTLFTLLGQVLFKLSSI